MTSFLTHSPQVLVESRWINSCYSGHLCSYGFVDPTPPQPSALTAVDQDGATILAWPRDLRPSSRSGCRLALAQRGFSLSEFVSFSALGACGRV